MSPEHDHIDDIFCHAAGIASSEERSKFLDDACDGDKQLRERVERLLAAQHKSDSFKSDSFKSDSLFGSSPGLGPTMDLSGTRESRSDHPGPEKPGSTIGPYKLLQQLGEGGMGVVYMAEQTKPVARRVALKIIKPGMDSRQVIARFEAERQALAVMDHPGIARVLDAGTTESGRPFFAMELVKGVPITQYCDEHRSSVRQRLNLFVDVCHAVQHAHQKGIIHRDIKPSNVLVAEFDDQAVPKVIDFGVAKAVRDRLTEKTMFTQVGQVVGTLEYMSPEQSKLNQLDVDTRSDIYSLGVLLYELLTGETPFDRKRLRSAAFDEMLRILREEDPPRPSIKVSSSGSLQSIAANRDVEPKRLTLLVRGELDWIVMKAMDKNRARRYDTANGFANDIKRYLNDEPVEACPPSVVYRLGKFARRNKVSLAIGSACMAALIAIAIGSMLTARQFRSLAERNATLAGEKQDALTAETEARIAAGEAQRDAERARDEEKRLRAEAERQNEIAQNALIDSRRQRERAEANFALARSAVDTFLNHVTDNELLNVPGLRRLREQLLSSAMTFYEDFTRDDANAKELLVELARAHYRIGLIRRDLGQDIESRDANAKSIELFERLRDEENKSVDVRMDLAKAYLQAGRFDETVKLCQEMLEEEPQNPEARSLLAETFNNLAVQHEDDVSTAMTFHQQALGLRESLAQDFPDNPKYLSELGSSLNSLGVVLGHNSEAIELLRRAVDYFDKAYSKAPQTILFGRRLCLGLNNMAERQERLGQQEAALRSFQRVVTTRRKLAFENPAVASLKAELYRSWHNLAKSQRAAGESQNANRSLRAAREVLENIPRNTPEEMFELAVVYGALAQQPDRTMELQSENTEDEREQNANDAMVWLNKAVGAGYRDLDALHSHKSLTALHVRDDFQQLVSKLTKEAQAYQLAMIETVANEQSLADLRQATDLLRNLIRSDPDDMEHQSTLAATLHAIGSIQARLKQFDKAEKSLREAYRMRTDLQRERPNDPKCRLDTIITHVATGHLDWVRERHQKSHQIYQDCLAQLDSLGNEQLGDDAIQELIANQEREICLRYAKIGLWTLADEYARRNVRRERIYDRNTDTWHSSVLTRTGSYDQYRDYTRLLTKNFETRYDTGRESHAWETASVAMHGSLLPDPIVPTDWLVSLAQMAVKDQPERDWLKVVLVLALHRDGQHKDAMNLAAQNRWGRDLTPSPDRQHWLVCAYVRAMTHRELGESEQARRVLNAAEECYQQFCRETLVSSEDQLPEPVTINWHWLTWPQQLRYEALQTIRGESAPDDAWQHLINVRGYRLIGEDAMADQELAAATAAAGDDGEAWILIARLGSDEDNWQVAMDHCTDQARLFAERGRWYAARDELPKAGADFVQATAPDSNGRPAIAAAPFTADEAVLHQQAWSKYLNAPIEFTNSLGMTFRLVPPGVFQMGTPQEDRERLMQDFRSIGGNENEIRKIEEEGYARVFLTEPVFAGRYEVTVAQFRKFVDDAGYQTDAERLHIGGFAKRNGWTRHPSHIWRAPAAGWKPLDEQPVVHISWNDAVSFCEWLSRKEQRTYSLPTEAQWEFACRSGSSSLYGIGDDVEVLDQIAWVKWPSRDPKLNKAEAVGLKTANAFGIHDMLGNVTEWCSDGYAPLLTTDIPLINPHRWGQSTHVTRGGAWYRLPQYARCAARFGSSTNVWDAGDGFRVWLKIDSEHSHWKQAGAETTASP